MPNKPSWLPDDAAATREFLASQTGQKLISILYNSVEDKDAASFEEESLNYRFAKGGRAVINKISQLASEQPREDDSGMQFVNTNV